MKAGFLNLALCLSEILTSKFVDLAEVASLTTTTGAEASWAALTAVKSCIRMSKDKQLKEQAKVADNAKTKVNTPDSLSVEQTKAYTIQMSKWRGKTLVAISDRLWGKTIETMHHTRCPLIHLSNMLKASVTDEDLLEKGTALSQLVLGKADSIHKEFYEICRSLSSKQHCRLT